MLDSSQLTVIVLAAGQGKRLKSDVPKVLHQAAGRPLVAHVVEALKPLGAARTVVVTSDRRDDFVSALGEPDVESGTTFVTQDPPRGTGDAVRIALRELGEPRGVVLVANGDTPLVTTVTYARLLEDRARSHFATAVLTARVSDPGGLGRIVRGEGNSVEAIVEEADATEEQRSLDEINGGVFAFDGEMLVQMLDKIDRENAQGEYYLTDVVELLRAAGERTVACSTDEEEVLGVNTRAQLAAVAAILRGRTCDRLMAEGVTIVDPETTYIDATVAVGRDATILPATYLEGDTRVGERAEVGPQTRVVDSVIEADASVTFSVVRGSVVGEGASVGPYASLRPGTRLERGAHVGTFVETKNTTIGENSKANHLSYLGDAEIGRGVNVGAGTITCNWDGTAKHKTVIDDDAYIGSDTMLVAPVRVGKRAATGAGSVVRDDVPDDALAIGVPARIVEGRGDRMGRAETTDEDETPEKK